MIPIIDVAKVGLLIENDEDVKVEDYKDIGRELYRAFYDVGFAYIKNSGITDANVAEILSKFQEFFNLDEEVKSKFNFEKDVNGYFAIGGENVQYGETDYKQAFNIGGMMLTNLDTMAPDAHVEGFSNLTSKFCDKCAKLSRRFFKLLSYGMKLKDVDYLTTRHVRMNGLENYTCLRSNLYPPVTDDLLDKLNVRLGAHSDYGTFTLLFQDDAGGLQIQDSSGNFIDAPYIPETIVMNIGDTMNLWTEGRLKSTVHRVKIPEERSIRTKPRSSLAYFLHADNEVPIEIMEYNDEADPPRPERMLFDPNSGPKTAIEWALLKFYKAHNLPTDNIRKY